jgi:hypothetical protein
MPIVANFFNPQEAAFAAEALKIAGIPCTQETAATEAGDELTLSVDDESFDRAALVIEKLTEHYLGGRPKVCPSCGAQGITSTIHSGALGDYTVHLCEQCHQSFVQRR